MPDRRSVLKGAFAALVALVLPRQKPVVMTTGTMTATRLEEGKVVTILASDEPMTATEITKRRYADHHREMAERVWPGSRLYGRSPSEDILEQHRILMLAVEMAKQRDQVIINVLKGRH